MTRLQLCSDVHLEEEEEDHTDSFEHILVPSAPILCLAGDIGNPYSRVYMRFLSYCSKNYEHVFLVAGNHEFFNAHPVANTLCHIRELVGSSFSNVTFLHMDAVEYAGMTFAGATLWSHVPPAYMAYAQAGMNDYKYVYNEPDKLVTPVITNQWNQQHVSWIKQVLASHPPGQPLVVITHHPPSMHGTSLPRYDKDPLRFCYRNNLDHLITGSSVSAWLCGHTHFCFLQHRGHAVLKSNAFRSRRYRKQDVLELQPPPFLHGAARMVN